MKVVHIISKDTGGAARAALRINKSLNLSGINSKVLVLYGKNQNIGVCIKNPLKINAFKLYRKINNFNLKRYGLEGRFYEARVGLDISKHPLVKEADIINLHWINDGMLSNKTLNKLFLTGKKIVWTMHDMYAFTAGCYYDNNCGQYESGCKKCPLADNNTLLERIIKKQFEKKREMYSNSNIKFVGCSVWMTECARRSIAISPNNALTIPNPIDMSVFQPRDKNMARKAFGIDTDKSIVLFGAMSADCDKRKGYELLRQVLKRLNKDKYIAVVFGNNGSVCCEDGEIQQIGVGRITSDEKLSELYSMADVFVAPSTQENLSNAVMEALSCDTPVVAFNIGGMCDMILHKENGYLATPFNIDDFTRGVEFCCTHELKCREYVGKKFELKTIAEKYINVYNM